MAESDDSTHSATSVVTISSDISPDPSTPTDRSVDSDDGFLDKYIDFVDSVNDGTWETAHDDTTQSNGPSVGNLDDRLSISATDSTKQLLEVDPEDVQMLDAWAETTELRDSTESVSKAHMITTPLLQPPQQSTSVLSFDGSNSVVEQGSSFRSTTSRPREHSHDVSESAELCLRVLQTSIKISRRCVPQVAVSADDSKMDSFELIDHILGLAQWKLRASAELNAAPMWEVRQLDRREMTLPDLDLKLQELARHQEETDDPMTQAQITLEAEHLREHHVSLFVELLNRVEIFVMRK